MTDNTFELTPHIVSAFLRKSPETFTKADIMEFVRSYGVKMVNFMYPAEDGRVKTLNFYINSREYLETIGVDHYDPLEIIQKTQGRMAEDAIWLTVEEIK